MADVRHVRAHSAVPGNIQPPVYIHTLSGYSEGLDTPDSAEPVHIRATANALPLPLPLPLALPLSGSQVGQWQGQGKGQGQGQGICCCLHVDNC